MTKTTIISCSIYLFKGTFIVVDTKQNEISSDTSFSPFEDEGRRELNKKIVNFRNVNFHELPGNFFQLDPTGQHINTFLITKEKLSQFKPQNLKVFNAALSQTMLCAAVQLRASYMSFAELNSS